MSSGSYIWARVPKYTQNSAEAESDDMKKADYLYLASSSLYHRCIT